MEEGVMGQVFAGRAPASLIEKLKMSDFWKEAPIEWVALAWVPFAGYTTNDFVDARLRTEVGSIAPEERACMLGWRLACAHGHHEASQCPGPWGAVWALRHGFPLEWDHDGSPGIPIQSIRQHITGTGRLRWEAQGDGSLLIETWRGPHSATEPHLVLSAVIPTEEPKWASSPGWNDGIEPSHIQIKAHAPYGRRHLDALLAALNAATWSAGVEGLSELNIWAGHIPVRVGDANPEPDPWDETLRPAWPSPGVRVAARLAGGYEFTGPVEGDGAVYCFEKRQWCVVVRDVADNEERFVPIRDITPIEGDE